MSKIHKLFISNSWSYNDRCDKLLQLNQNITVNTIKS